MASPSPVHALQGASRMTGGILRGRAHGNVFNHADGEDETYTAPRKGRVFVHQSPRDPKNKNSKAETSIMSEVTPQLKPALKALARRLSIVSSKSYFLIYVEQKIFYTLLELNQRIYVYEDDTWAAKGRYETALEDNDDAMWTFDESLNLDVLYVLVVSESYFFSFRIQIYKIRPIPTIFKPQLKLFQNLHHRLVLHIPLLLTLHLLLNPKKPF